MGGRLGLPGIAVESAAAATIGANGGLSTWQFMLLKYIAALLPLKHV